MTDTSKEALRADLTAALQRELMQMQRADEAESKLAEAVEEKLDAIRTLDAWFNRRKLAHDAVDQAVIDAASGYLRTSRVGGMPQKDSDLVLAVIQDMAHLSLFADLFARATLKSAAIGEAARDLVPALLASAEAAEAERDALKAKLALRTGEADAKALIIKELESEVKEAQIDAIRAALEEAAEVAANEADYVPVRPDSFRKAIRAIDPAAIAAKLKGGSHD